MARLCQPAASRCSVHCIELAVLLLYDCEDGLGVTSCYNALVQLDLLCGWPATVARIAAELAVLSLGLNAGGTCERSVPMCRPVVTWSVTWSVTARVMAAMLS
jgi:hypothetical protein